MKHHETLSIELWIDRLEKISLASVEQEALPDKAKFERLLRQAFHLSQIAPHPFSGMMRLRCCEEDFERLLEKGALDAAAFQLVTPGLDPLLDDFTARRPTQSRERGLSPAATTDPTEAVAREIFASWVDCLLSFSDRWRSGGGVATVELVTPDDQVGHGY